MHNDWVLDTVFSADSSHLVSISRDRSMNSNEIATERFVDNITSITPGAPKGGLMTIDRNPKNDELLAGGADGTPKIYQMHRTKARQIGDDFNLILRFRADARSPVLGGARAPTRRGSLPAARAMAWAKCGFTTRPTRS